MEITSKPASESYTVMNELVLPNDTNPLHNLMGGRLLHLMDIAAAISAQRHSNHIVVTASVDNVSFKHPVKLGDVITITAKVTRAFHTSMEVRIEVYSENIPSGTKIKSNEAFYTFVALDDDGKPALIPELIPETEEEKRFYETAGSRREFRLILAGKMKPENATGLRAIFFPADDVD
ncbi:acyl-CoA thioesterase [Arcticibacter sp. MXS-1]|uniref:acyl-CoA thioesterase n=1 Tax=Arcticibacter sp. MXS-1 TaxID=3341726 RepID=UPI0035A9195B